MMTMNQVLRIVVTGRIIPNSNDTNTHIVSKTYIHGTKILTHARTNTAKRKTKLQLKSANCLDSIGTINLSRHRIH